MCIWLPKYNYKEGDREIETYDRNDFFEKCKTLTDIHTY